MMDGFESVPTELPQPAAPTPSAQAKQMGLPSHFVGLAPAPLRALWEVNCVASRADFDQRLRRKPWMGPRRSREFLLVEWRSESEKRTKPPEAVGRRSHTGQ